jgi:CO dehydrogenase/acetyl-CoA synthase epsilon subunit
MTNGDIKVKGNIYRYHKKARVRKKIINRRCKVVAELIHKTRQRSGYDLSFSNLSKKEFEKNLKNMIKEEGLI